MALLPELEQVNPDAETQAFWDYCRRRELRFQRCGACGRFRHPPKIGCPYCGSADVDWVPVAGRGRVFSYTVARHPVMPMLQARVPYNVVLVEFDDAPGVRLITNILDCPPEALAIDLTVDLVWDPIDGDMLLPRMRRAS